MRPQNHDMRNYNDNILEIAMSDNKDPLSEYAIIGFVIIMTLGVLAAKFLT